MDWNNRRKDEEIYHQQARIGTMPRWNACAKDAQRKRRKGECKSETDVSLYIASKVFHWDASPWSIGLLNVSRIRMKK